MAILMVQVYFFDVLGLPLEAFDERAQTGCTQAPSFAINMHENVVFTASASDFGSRVTGNILRPFIPILNYPGRIGKVNTIGNIVDHRAQNSGIFPILFYKVFHRLSTAVMAQRHQNTRFWIGRIRDLSWLERNASA
jgi:hypothetical protein